MKNLLKFSVKWERLDDRHLVLRLVNADSIESRLKPEEETLEAFAEGIETLGFLLNDKDAELRRGDNSCTACPQEIAGTAEKI